MPRAYSVSHSPRSAIPSPGSNPRRFSSSKRTSTSSSSLPISGLTLSPDQARVSSFLALFRVCSWYLAHDPCEVAWVE